jgi:hypothetical protein
MGSSQPRPATTTDAGIPVAILARAFEYWCNIDTTIGEKIQTATNVSHPTAPLVGTSRRTAR